MKSNLKSLYLLVPSFLFLGLVLSFNNCSNNGFSLVTSNSSERSSTGPTPTPTPVPAEKDPWSSPNLGVHSGGVANGAPKIDGYLNVDSAFPNSKSFITQWKKINPILTSHFKTGTTVDPVLGMATHEIVRPGTNESIVRIFKNSSSGNYVYELEAHHGWLDSVGSSNLFISAPTKAETTLQFSQNFSFEAKLLQFDIKVTKTNPVSADSVLGQFFSGFTLQHINEQGAVDVSMFVQIQHGDTRGHSGAYRGCYPHGSSLEIVYSNVEPEDYYWNQVDTATGPLQKREFLLNKYICRAIAQPFSCTDGTTKNFSSYGADLSKWKITSSYIGFETNTADFRGLDQTTVQQRLTRFADYEDGIVNAKLQISNINIVPSSTPVYSSCAGL